MKININYKYFEIYGGVESMVLSNFSSRFNIDHVKYDKYSGKPLFAKLKDKGGNCINLTFRQQGDISINELTDLIYSKFIYEEEWTNEENIPHREDGPAITQYWKNGNKKSEGWYRNGKPYAGEYGYSYIQYGQSTNFVAKHFDLPDGSRLIVSYEGGYLRSREYKVGSKLHREDGPAAITYYANGQKQYEEYYINNEPYRVDGPAYIQYDTMGNILQELWHTEL